MRYISLVMLRWGVSVYTPFLYPPNQEVRDMKPDVCSGNVCAFNRVGLLSLCLLVFTGFLIISGCSGFAKIRSIPGYEQQVGFKELEKNWKSYDILYTGLSDNRPEAVLFITKAEDRFIEAKTWKRITDQESLSKVIDLIRLGSRYSPGLWKIQGPDDNAFGYVFSGRRDITIKMVDKNTLKINRLAPLPSGPA